MGIMNFLGIGKELADPIRAVGDLYTTDKDKIEAEKNLQTELNKPVISQLTNNSIMASSPNFFNSGWQPLMGWTCGFLILLYYAPQIILVTVMWYSQCMNKNVIVQFPMRPDDLLNLVYLLFGFGTYHFFKNKPND